MLFVLELQVGFEPILEFIFVLARTIEVTFGFRELFLNRSELHDSIQKAKHKHVLIK